MSFMSGMTTVIDARSFRLVSLLLPWFFSGMLWTCASAQETIAAPPHQTVASSANSTTISIAHPVAKPVVAQVVAPTAQPTTPTAISGDDLWLVSSRRLPDPCQCRATQAECDYFQWINGCWHASSAEQFWATQSADRLTCVHVHGNRMTIQDAKQQGVQIYRKLACNQGHGFRVVVWTWPSDRIPGPARDIKVKEVRADGESYYLGNFLGRFPKGTPLSVMGYSFGARSVVGSLHLLGGGTVAGHRLAAEQVDAVHPRVVLLAAAMPADWLSPRGSRCLALGQTSEFVSFFNSRDPALKIYRLTAGRPDLVGLEQFSRSALGIPAALVRQYNATNTIGKSHSFEDYLESPQLMQSIRQHLLHQTSM